MLKVGTLAPDFEATLDDGSAFRLSERCRQSPVVLYFYPAAFSGGCTSQACGFRDAYSDIRDTGATLFGVSRDSADSQRDFQAAYSLPFPMISDADGRIAALYEVSSHVPVLRPRITYVIDRDRVVRAAFRHDVAIGRHITDTLDAVRALAA
jgi:peroxiredoxin Q/BCP